jgi:hypothetical protein
MGRYQAGASWLADAGLIKGGGDAVKSAMKADGFSREYDWGKSGGMTKAHGRSLRCPEVPPPKNCAPSLKITSERPWNRGAVPVGRVARRGAAPNTLELSKATA